MTTTVQSDAAPVLRRPSIALYYISLHMGREVENIFRITLANNRLGCQLKPKGGLFCRNLWPGEGVHTGVSCLGLSGKLLD